MIRYKVVIPFEHFLLTSQVEEFMSLLFLHIEGGWIPNHQHRTCTTYATYKNGECANWEVFAKYFPPEGIFTLPTNDIKSLMFETKEHKAEEVRLLLYGYMMEAQNTVITQKEIKDDTV